MYARLPACSAKMSCAQRNKRREMLEITPFFAPVTHLTALEWIGPHEATRSQRVAARPYYPLTLYYHVHSTTVRILKKISHMQAHNHSLARCYQTIYKKMNSYLRSTRTEHSVWGDITARSHTLTHSHSHSHSHTHTHKHTRT